MHRQSAALLASAAVLLTLVTSSAAHAQIQGDFTSADANRDGRVTLEEFQAYATAGLNAASGPKADRFKRLTSEKQEQVLAQRFKKADRGHKGYLTPADWAGA